MRVLAGGSDEGGKERMRREGAALKLGMELASKEEGVARELDHLGELPIGREPAQHEPAFFETLMIFGRDLEAMTMPLLDLSCAINRMREGALF